MSSAATRPAAPRLILVAGPGGSGSTTVAALTALHVAAERQAETVLVSADPLAEQILTGTEQPDGDPDLHNGVRLRRAEPDADASALLDLLDALPGGAAGDPLDASELGSLPGAAEIWVLLAVADELRRERAAVVVDAGSALPQLLRIPEALALLADRLLPAPLRLLQALRRGSPGAAAAGTVDRLLGRLLAVHAALTDPVLCRFLLVAGATGMRQQLTRRLALLSALYGQPARLLDIARQPAEPVGDRLAELARRCPLPVDGAVDPERVGPDADPAMAPDGEWHWRIALPGARRDELALSRSGDDILLTVVGHTRRVELPSVLTRCTVLGAQHTDAGLLVRFAPDPARWPEALLPEAADGRAGAATSDGSGDG